jgi:hypothetical protein
MTSPMHGSIESHSLAFSMRAVFLVLSRHSAELGSRGERRRRRRCRSCAGAPALLGLLLGIVVSVVSDLPLAPEGGLVLGALLGWLWRRKGST